MLLFVRRTFAKNLAVAAAKQCHKDTRILLLDLRNHGQSTAIVGLHAPHDMEATAADVLQFIRKDLQGHMPEVVAGLSLGGKVTLELLKQLQHKQQHGHHSEAHPLELPKHVSPLYCCKPLAAQKLTLIACHVPRGDKIELRLPSVSSVMMKPH